MRVALLGAGVMGRGIARVFLRSDAEVTLCSRRETTLMAARRALAGERGGVLRVVTDVAEAVSGAELVVESVPEHLELKQSVLAAAERGAPSTAVIATNTSALPLPELADALARPQRFLGLHWFNPAYLIPLVEVVPAPATDPEVVKWSRGVLQRAGKRPLELSRAVPGYVANRLQYALIREALQLIADGVADATAIDSALTDCLGLRWAAIGPMRSTDLAGVDTAVAVAEQLFPELSAVTSPPPTLLDLRDHGHLGVRSGEGFHRYPDPDATMAERDRRLEAVLTALASLD